MKFYDQTNGKMLAKANFLTNQIKSISIVDEDEEETTYIISLCMDNLLPVAPVKEISVIVELLLIATKDNNADLFAVLQSTNECGEMIETIVKASEREIISLLVYMINKRQEQNKMCV